MTAAGFLHKRFPLLVCKDGKTVIATAAHDTDGALQVWKRRPEYIVPDLPGNASRILKHSLERTF